MTAPDASTTAGGRLRAETFQRLADMVEQRIGIRLPAAKRDLVEHRLQRRVRALGLRSLEDYCARRLGKTSLEEEFPFLVNCLTTNKTDFFREPSHFTYLRATVLPTLLAQGDVGFRRPLRVWSAACSTGPEPYTIAMVLAEHGRLHGEFLYEVHGSDIDTDVLVTAARGIYDISMIPPIPDDLRHRYLLRARNRLDRTVRIAPELRRQVRFWPMNLLSPDPEDTSLMDIIFCRNVLIYFNRPNQQRALEGLCARLRPGGTLFVGHSETLSGLNLPVRAVAPATYVRL